MDQELRGYGTFGTEGITIIDIRTTTLLSYTYCRHTVNMAETTTLSVSQAPVFSQTSACLELQAEFHQTLHFRDSCVCLISSMRLMEKYCHSSRLSLISCGRRWWIRLDSFSQPGRAYFIMFTLLYKCLYKWI